MFCLAYTDDMMVLAEDEERGDGAHVGKDGGYPR